MKEPLGKVESIEVDVFAETVKGAKKLFLSAKELRYDWTDPEAFMDNFRETSGSARLRHNPEELITSAGKNWHDFQELRLGIAAELSVGRELPPCAVNWLAALLRDQVKPPRRKAGRQPNEGLTVLVYFAVLSGVERGLVASRSEATKSHLSACDAVAKALGDLRLPFASFEAVKDIWFAGKRHFENPDNQGIPAT